MKTGFATGFNAFRFPIRCGIGCGGFDLKLNIHCNDICPFIARRWYRKLLPFRQSRFKVVTQTVTLAAVVIRAWSTTCCEELE
jgi:hypothetical protein